MSLPKQLIKSYTSIANCDLVVNGKVNDDNIKEFVNELNKAIPVKDNVLAFTIYKFNRNKYLAHKSKFLDDIIGFQYYENMILWTDYDDILKYFKLENKIFLGWDRYTNRYKAYTPRTQSTSTQDHSPHKKTTKENFEEMSEMIDDQLDGDVDRLELYMNEKREKLQKELAN